MTIVVSKDRSLSSRINLMSGQTRKTFWLYIRINRNYIFRYRKIYSTWEITPFGYI